MSSSDVTLLGAFVAGLASFLLPCVYPLVPVYLGSVCGPGLFEPKSARIRISILLHSLSFVVGSALVFTALGAVAGLAGFAIGPHLGSFRYIAGGLLVLFGLLMLAALKIPWLNYEKRLNTSMGNTPGYLRSFLIGAVFSLAWVPCTGFILGGILTLAGASATAWRGALLLAVYSLGLGIPFLIIGVVFDSVAPYLKKVQRYSKWVYLLGGVLLIAMGIIILLNKMALFYGSF
ncbi:cytochrome c biogenesis CcdA family protein [Chloroflexota bacterium]